MFAPALLIRAENEGTAKHAAGHHLSKLGKVPERSEGGKVVQSHKAHMRLTDRPISSKCHYPIAVRLPSQAPRSSGGCRRRRLGGCTIVQVENELKGKPIPGSSRAAGEEEPHK